MTPVFKSNDSPETAAAAYFLGIGHPPGYPLFNMCAKITTFLPVGNTGFRVNLFSVILALLTLLLAYKTSGIIAPYFWEQSGAKRRLAGILAVLALAFSRVFWSQAAEAKGGIYMLNLLFTSALIYIFLKLLDGFQKKLLYLVSLIFGLAFANHWPSAAIMAPFFVYIIFIHRGKLSAGRAMFSALFFAAGLAAYIYLPIRAGNKPPLNWGNPVDPSAILNVILRRDYSNTVKPGLDVYIYQLKETIRTFALNYSFLAVFAAAGAAAMFKKARKKVFFLASIMILTIILVAFVNLTKKDIVYLIDIFLLPALYIMALFIAPGAAAFAALKIPGTAVKGALIAAFAAMFVFNLGADDFSRDFTAYDYGNNILSSLEPGAVYIADGDYNAMPVFYILEVEKKRPDIKFAVSSFLAFGWGIDDFRSRTGINAEMAPYHRIDNIKSILNNGGNLSIYMNYSGSGDISASTPGLFSSHCGLLNKLGLNNNYSGPDTEPFKLYNYRGIFNGKKDRDVADTSLITWYPFSMVNCAAELLSAGDYAQSAELYREAMLFPVDEPRDNICYDISMSYFKLSDTEGERRYLKKAISYNTKIPQVYERLGLIYFNMGLLDNANDLFKRAKLLGSTLDTVDKGMGVISGFSQKDRLEIALMKGNEKLVKNDYVSAGEIFDFLIEKGYKRDIIYKNLGVFHFKTGDYSGALEDFKKSDNETHNAVTVLYLAMDLEKLGDLKKAEIELEKGLNDFPQDKALSGALSLLKERVLNGKSINSVNGQGRSDKDKQRP
jgi:tetratricopeptide (TPR) repeat protein